MQKIITNGFSWYRRHQALVLVSAAVLLLASLLLLSPRQETGFYVFLGLKALGVVLYIAIIMVRQNIAPAFVERLCSLTTFTDCRQVIRSRPLGIVDMADVGVVYFSGGLLILLSGLTGFHTRIHATFLFVLSWLSIPYLLFSLYYQYAVIRKWCTLCLSVWCVMVVEIALSLHYGMALTYLGISYWKNGLFVLSVFLFVVAVWRMMSHRIVNGESIGLYKEVNS